MINLDLIAETWEQDEEPCKGLFFRGKNNMFVNDRNEYVYQERMTPLKRMSCKGCSQCGPLLDDLHEWIAGGQGPVINDLEHGALYRLEITNVQTDWESGYADDWDLEFVRVKNSP